MVNYQPLRAMIILTLHLIYIHPWWLFQAELKELAEENQNL